MITDFSSLLKRRREATGWTQKELAVHLGKSESYISLLECGARLPSEATARRLASILGADEQKWAFWACEARQIQRIYQRYPEQTSLLLIELERIKTQGNQDGQFINDSAPRMRMGIDSQSGVAEVP